MPVLLLRQGKKNEEMEEEEEEEEKENFCVAFCSFTPATCKATNLTSFRKQ